MRREIKRILNVINETSFFVFVPLSMKIVRDHEDEYNCVRNSVIGGVYMEYVP